MNEDERHNSIFLSLRVPYTMQFEVLIESILGSTQQKKNALHWIIAFDAQATGPEFFQAQEAGFSLLFFKLHQNLVSQNIEFTESPLHVD